MFNIILFKINKNSIGKNRHYIKIDHESTNFLLSVKYKGIET